MPDLDAQPTSPRVFPIGHAKSPSGLHQSRRSAGRAVLRSRPGNEAEPPTRIYAEPIQIVDF